MNQDEMKAQRDVLAVWPDAYAFQWTGFWRIYSRGRGHDLTLGGPTKIEYDAWTDAASKLPAPPVQQEQPLIERIREVAEITSTFPAWKKGSPLNERSPVEGQAGEVREPNAMAHPAIDVPALLASKRAEQHGVEMPPRPIADFYDGIECYPQADADAYIDALEARIRELESKD